MKKIGILNHDLSDVVASMGHTDMLTVCDAGLPIPLDVRRIDLALKKGLPSFADTLEQVALELQVERVFVAAEMRQASPQVEGIIKMIFPKAEVEVLSHEDFKQLTHQSKAIVRTGEFTPYANVILVSGTWGFESGN
jgi:D-ribose pyranase